MSGFSATKTSDYVVLIRPKMQAVNLMRILFYYCPRSTQAQSSSDVTALICTAITLVRPRCPKNKTNFGCIPTFNIFPEQKIKVIVWLISRLISVECARTVIKYAIIYLQPQSGKDSGRPQTNYVVKSAGNRDKQLIIRSRAARK